MLSIKCARKLLAGLADVGCSHDHGCTTSEQLLNECRSDRSRCRARHQRNIARVRFVCLRLGNGCDVTQQICALCASVFCIPLRLLRNRVTGACKTCRFKVRLAQGDAHEIFTSLCPTVIKQHGLALVEDRGDLLDPAGTKLCLDGFHDGGVRSEDFSRLFFHTQLVQQCAGCSHESVGDLLLVGIQCSGIHHATARSVCLGCLGHCNTMARSNILHGLVNHRADLCLSCCRWQGGKGTAADRILRTAAQQDLSLHVRRPRGREPPRGAQVIPNKSRFQSYTAKQLAQACAHGFRQHRAKGAISRCCGIHTLVQGCHISFGRTINSRYTKLRGHIHQQLVTARRHTTGQLFDRVRIIDLLRADLVLQGEEYLDGVCSVERQLLGRSRRGRRCRRCHWCRWCGFWCRRSWCGCRGRFGVGFRCCVFSGCNFFRFGCGHHIFQHDHVLVGFHVEYGDMDAHNVHFTLSQVGQGRGGRKTDLNDLLHPWQEEVLGFNPAHRGSELPRQKLNQQRARQGVAVSVFRSHATQTLGRNLFHHGVNELLSQFEGAGNQVGDVAVDQRVNVDKLGQQLIQLLCEVGDTAAQHAGVEWDIHTRHRHVRAWIDGICLLIQRSKTTLRTGDGVLLALDVVVHNLQELTSVFGHLCDVGFNFFRANTNHVRAQRAHAVIRVALRIARHQGTHGRTARVHNVNHGFELKDVAQGCERGVFAKRVARIVGI